MGRDCVRTQLPQTSFGQTGFLAVLGNLGQVILVLKRAYFCFIVVIFLPLQLDFKFLKVANRVSQFPFFEHCLTLQKIIYNCLCYVDFGNSWRKGS